MKQRILFSILILTSVLVFFACNDDEISDAYLPSANISPAVSSVTLFDTPFTLSFDVSNPDVTSFTVTGGASDKTVTVTELKGIADFTSADFGEYWAIDSVSSFNTIIDFGSSKATQTFPITVVDALAASANGAAAEYDTSKVAVALTGETVFNDLGEVVIERKVITEADPDPDFAELKKELSVTTKFDFKDTIMGVDYHQNDTIVYRITATSGGGYTETSSVEIPVKSKAIPTAVAAGLSSSENSFVLMPGGDDEPDFGTLTFTSSDSERGFTSEDVAFVSLTDDDVDDFSGLVAFVEGNTTSNAIDNVVTGDKIAFKFSDETLDYYGIITITDVESTVIGDPEDAIAFTYAFEKVDIKEE